jgi:hypothetical protein
MLLGIATSLIFLSQSVEAKLDFSNPFFPKLTKDSPASILFSQIKGLDYNGCTGTNKVTNVSFVNGDLQIVCATDEIGGAGTGDITSVQGDVWITNGADAGDVDLVFNTSQFSSYGNSIGFNSTFNSTYNIYAYNQTTPAIDYYKQNPAGYYNVTTLPASSGNASWNQSFANTLYASIIWGYNQTPIAGNNITVVGTTVGLNGTSLKNWLDTLYQTIGSYLLVSDLPLTNRTISHWDNVTNKPANLDIDSTNDLLITDLPLHNRTLVNCLNITGADPDFCNDATAAGGALPIWINSSSGININSSYEKPINLTRNMTINNGYHLFFREASLNNYITSSMSNRIDINSDGNVVFLIGGIIKSYIYTDGFVIGSGETNKDYRLEVDGENTQFLIEFMEDEGYVRFNNPLLFLTSSASYWRNTNQNISSPSSDRLEISSPNITIRTTNLTIPYLNSTNCDIKGTSTGSLICGTDETSGGTNANASSLGFIEFESGDDSLTADGLYMGQSNGCGGVLGGTIDDCVVVAPQKITIQRLDCYLETGGVGNFTLIDDGTNTELQCLTGGSGGACSDTGSVQITAGSLITILFDETTASTSGHGACSITYPLIANASQETDPIFSNNLTNGFSKDLTPLTNNTQSLGNSTKYWNTTFQYRFCLGGINCWKQLPFYYDDENNPNVIYVTEGINMLGKQFIVSNIEAEDASGIHLNDTVVITDQWNVTGNYFFGKFPFTNFTGTDDNACTGTDKISNVTFKDGTLSIICTTDVSGSGGDGTGGWINDSINTNTSRNVNVQSGANVTANWFKGLFNWTTDLFFIFNGANLQMNTTQLNNTISNLGVNIGFNSTFNATYDAKVSFDNTNLAYLNNTQTFTKNQTIDANLNITGNIYMQSNSLNITQNGTCIIITGTTTISRFC